MWFVNYYFITSPPSSLKWHLFVDLSEKRWVVRKYLNDTLHCVPIGQKFQTQKRPLMEAFRVHCNVTSTFVTMKMEYKSIWYHACFVERQNVYKLSVFVRLLQTSVQIANITYSSLSGLWSLSFAFSKQKTFFLF